MAGRRAKRCAWCGREPLKKIEIALSKKLLDFDPPLLLCLSCLGEETKCDEEELKYLAERFKEEGCGLFK
ncbi:MAG: hypothetical protein K2H64_05090 [Desulfovibrio sp.]|nr:hypothetical protein [Desulfovibrio sp.]